SVLAARLLSYRIVNQVDGIPYGALDQHGSSAVDRLKRTAAIVTGRLSHGVLAVTPEIKTLLTQLARIPPERITVIPNGVDVDFFIPQERQAALARVGLDPAGTYIVFCGGFHHWSDFDTIVESFALVSAKRPEVRLLLVGDGPERERIERRAHELDVTDKIVLTGMVYKRELVRDYLGAATVALLAYRTATIGRTSASPIKLTEYLAAGRAVVAIDMPGISGLLNESEAGIVVPGAAEPMAQAILSLLADGVADEFGARGRALAQTRLSWQSVIDRTLPLFTR
ncbi:MAG: glycosyltransferase, partial [Solirubrobacteraceae bacterium]